VCVRLRSRAKAKTRKDKEYVDPITAGLQPVLHQRGTTQWAGELIHTVAQDHTKNRDASKTIERRIVAIVSASTPFGRRITLSRQRILVVSQPTT
jgi:hypothetical protein